MVTLSIAINSLTLLMIHNRQINIRSKNKLQLR